MTWGESEASSEMVMVSERWPAASGAKVIVMVQVAFTLMVPLQPFVVVKSPTLFPPIATEEM